MKKDNNGNGNCESNETTIKVLGTGAMDVEIQSETKACNFDIFNVQSTGDNIISYDFCTTITLKSSIDVTVDDPIITSAVEVENSKNE